MNELPTYEMLMLPILEAFRKQEELLKESIRERVAQHFALSEEQLATRLPGGSQKTFNNRIGWAITYLFKAGLLERPRKAVYKLSLEGQRCLKENLSQIDVSFLTRYPAFNEFKTAPVKQLTEKEQEILSKKIELTPEEQIESGVKQIQDEVLTELLNRVKSLPSDSFEQLVLHLLVGMGYGGSLADVQGVAKGADGGIDGIVNQDHLGLDRIYIQAKRWEHPVGRPIIQGFVGALAGLGASKGVIITTSSFAQPAKEYASYLTDRRIVLVDGKQMVQLMLKHGIGVSVKQTYTVQRLDEDFFLELEG